MNIAILCYHRPGGSGIVAHETGVSLAQTGRHNVHFVGLEPPFRYLDEFVPNVQFHEIQLRDYPVWAHSPYTLSAASQLADIIEHYEIDLIHSHYAIPHAVIGLLARDIAERDVKTVVTLHGTDITLVGSHPTFKRITRHAINKSDGVTTVSDHLKEETERKFGIEPGRITRVYNFVNAERFNPDLTHDAKCKCGVGVTRKIMVHASNLRPVKVPLDVVHVFDLVQKSGVDCELWIIGDGPMRGDMEELVRKLGLQDRVRFLGMQLEVGRLLVCCNLFLLTSEQESFGLAALEAMACGVPVVATNTGGLPEVIDDGVSGCLMDVGDVARGAELCRRLLTDDAFSASVREAGLRRAFDEFGQDRIIGEYEDLYASLV